MKIHKVYTVNSENSQTLHFVRKASAEAVAANLKGTVKEESIIVFETIKEFEEWNRTKR